MISKLPIYLMKFPANFSQYIIWWTPHFVFVNRKRYLAYELSNTVARRKDFDDMSRTTWETKNYSVWWDGHDVACRVHVFVAAVWPRYRFVVRSVLRLRVHYFVEVRTLVAERCDVRSQNG